MKPYPEMKPEFQWMAECYPFYPEVQAIRLSEDSEPIWFNAVIHDLVTGEPFYEKRAFDTALDAKEHCLLKMKEIFDDTAAKTHLL